MANPNEFDFAGLSWQTTSMWRRTDSIPDLNNKRVKKILKEWIQAGIDLEKRGPDDTLFVMRRNGFLHLTTILYSPYQIPEFLTNEDS